MKLQIQSVGMEANEKLNEFIRKKADKLDTFYDKIIDGEVFLKTDHDDNNENKIVEFKVNVPGHTFFANKHARSFEAATDEVVDAIKSQILKHKEKHEVNHP